MGLQLNSHRIIWLWREYCDLEMCNDYILRKMGNGYWTVYIYNKKYKSLLVRKQRFIKCDYTVFYQEYNSILGKYTTLQYLWPHNRQIRVISLHHECTQMYFTLRGCLKILRIRYQKQKTKMHGIVARPCHSPSRIKHYAPKQMLMISKASFDKRFKKHNLTLYYSTGRWKKTSKEC